MSEHQPEHTTEDVNFAAVPVPRTRETLYVCLSCEHGEPRVIVGRGAEEPADMDLAGAEQYGLGVLMAARAGHDLYDTNPSRRFNGYPSAT